MSVHSVQAWRLDRYARFVSSKANECGKWKHYNDSSDHIVMTVTDLQQLIISQRSVIFESHSLVNAGSYIRGLSRSDSLLFMYKFKEETRKFKIRFCRDGTSSMSAEEACMKAVKKLSAFFPIKINVIVNGAANSKQLNAMEKKDMDLTHSRISSMQVKSSTEFCEEVTLGAVAQAVLRCKSFPLAYHQHQQSLDMIPQLLITCLGDPTFPSFVEAVEAAIKLIVDDSL